MKFEEAYTFDDLTLVPRHSDIRSRKEPDTSTTLSPRRYVGDQTRLEVPIIAAPMNTVTETAMAVMMTKLGAGSVIHRYMSIEEQCEMWFNSFVPSVPDRYEPWMAVGATGDYMDRIKALRSRGVRKFCVDVANGHSQVCIEAVRYLRDSFPDCHIMAGNVCSAEGALALEEAGANTIRVGLGCGSVCSTRLVTGFGVPQLSAIKWCSEAVNTASIIADGGIRGSGDVVKAIAMGADAVMIGGLLAGADETAGKIERDKDTGQLYKYYNGMASQEGREDWFGREVSRYVPEGVSTKVWHKGSAKKIVEQLNDGLKVGMSFAGARTLEELRSNARWAKITDNGRKESNPNKKMFK